MIKIIGTVRTRTVVCYHCHVLLSYEVSDIQKKNPLVGCMYQIFQ